VFAGYAKEEGAEFDARGVPPEVRLALFKTMLLIRRFEELIVEVYGEQEMKTPVHLYIGEEAVAAGVCAHLEDSDYIFTTHRSHGHCLAKGVSPVSLLAEFYGRKTGCCHGRGGSMHPASPEHGVLGTSAIVGGGIPLAAGAALAAKMRGDGRVSVAFFGDGATEEGAFHETLSFASLHRLPVVFVCENNFYATTSPLTARQPHADIYRHAEAYDIPALHIDGNDVLAVFHAAGEAVARARACEGPTLIEAKTYRWKGHVGPECDHEKGCRPISDLHVWERRCPVERFREYLLRERIVTGAELEELESELREALARALREAHEAPLPDPSELADHVYYSEGEDNR
jgi:pyruvate dehydrogenase E1 component alpha subunit